MQVISLDGGHGITRRSLQYWQENGESLGDVNYVRVTFFPLVTEEQNVDGQTYRAEYNMEVAGEGGRLFLSGCNCGYSGEGPSGTLKILAQLGVPEDLRKRVLFEQDICLVKKATGWALNGCIVP